MPSPWVTRALREELPAKELSTGRTYRVEVGEAMAAASITRARLDHPYSPSTTPSVDGFGCLHREYDRATGLWSQRTCPFIARVHPTGASR